MLPSILFRERCVNFSVAVVKLADLLPKNARGKHTADQLFRSATSVGANVHEARGAESRADFIHKIQLALKEAREAHYWLLVVHKTEMIKSNTAEALAKECDELAAILASSAMTARKNGTASK
jgi:four helix bundle protein